MTKNNSTISVSSADAFRTLSEKLELGEQYKFRDIKQVLFDNFEGINKDQCSSLIHRAHSSKNGVLVKDGKFYSLRIIKQLTNGLEKAKYILEEALKQIEGIPANEVKTVEQFKELNKIRETINLLVIEEEDKLSLID